jgi:hypothetical protein
MWMGVVPLLMATSKSAPTFTRISFITINKHHHHHHHMVMTMTSVIN